MLKNLKAVILFSLIISLFISCTKDIEAVIPNDPDPIESTTPEAPEEETSSPEEEVKDSEEEANSEEDKTLPEEKPSLGSPNENLPGQIANSIEIGTGSGDLTIDGNDSKIQGKNLIVIKAGTYGSISVKNLRGSINAPVFIKNGGQVTIRGGMHTENITDVTIAGDNTPGIEYGFNFHDISYRALTLSGKMSGVTLKNLHFKNVRDYVIFADLAKINYQGTGDTRTERFKILYSKFDNTSNIQFTGNFNSSQDNGFLKDLEIAHNVIVNSNGGGIAYFPNVQDYDIHHNIVNNYNPTNDRHNGIFHMIGNGKFHNNTFTNYQGNMIRAWVFSRGNSPATVEFYNNTAYNTRKYGAFEIQGFDRYLVSGKTTYVNAKVYNNTVGRMNTSKDWDGAVLDLYNYGGTLEYYNNLGFDLYQSRPITDMINNMSDTKIVRKENNKYFGSSPEAVSNVSDLRSKHPGIGSNL